MCSSRRHFQEEKAKGLVMAQTRSTAHCVGTGDGGGGCIVVSGSQERRGRGSAGAQES